MFRARPSARLLAVHAASGSSLPVYRSMFYRALSNAARINGTGSVTWKLNKFAESFKTHTLSLTKPPDIYQSSQTNVPKCTSVNEKPKGKSAADRDRSIMTQQSPAHESAGGYYVIIAFHWKRFVQWTCRISENLSGECQLSKIGLWQQETEEVLMVSVITDIGFTLGVIAFNPQRKSGRPEQRDVQVQHVSSTGWLKHSPPERGRLLYSSLIAIKGRGGEKKRKINFSEELTHSSSLKMTV